MHVTVTTEDDAIVTVDVDPATVVENLKAILEAETDVPTREQVLLFNGGELANDDVLSAKNVGEGDLLMLLRKRGGGGGGVGAAANGANDNPTAMRPDGSAVDPAAFQRAIRADAHAMQSLRANNPSLHGAILNDDPSAMQQMLRDAATARKRAEDARQAEIDLLNADPFDLDAQRKIEEAIRQKNVDENFETAMETTPEAFGSVIMLYVDMEVNGHALKVFVDSGAQMTIMSLGCAIRLGLERLIDKRWRGVAKGVGTQKIIGRVHQAPITVAGSMMPCAITVLEKEQDMDFIFGLDMLRRHQCQIDLKDNVLRLGTIEKAIPFYTLAIPFLGESELPSFAKAMGEPEPEEAAGGAAAAAAAAAAAGGGGGVGGGGGGAAAAPAPAGGGGGGDAEGKVAKLMELGFDRAKCVEALQACGWNEEHAASLLFSGGF
ncbi:ubiquitin associated protein [Micromonas pusilla CCMP1545]|uniref:Ubiquitin associated protein n=1 Tax=Micromonas pusilla (strain CCMP1545) TaxID=564608 RepID=C1N9M6_MICPC|nr:ubiquitin associated protein [Micromonas pusilla CCMP1545]EEH50972.1 ubiquitin associated protein [Micromonas pusilla CCMP1545]|eukprot:XP_003064638.1 ubiquitin associated protein [Micromonas pusilla CCMP1545]